MADEVPVPASDDALLLLCEVEFVRAGGPGGQHRNKRFTGVRLTHRPTGLVVIATERRSQAQNLHVAVERLAALLDRHAWQPPPRRPTRPSKAVHRRRVDNKRRRGQVKAMRRTSEEG